MTSDSLLLSGLSARWRLVCANIEQAKVQEVVRVLTDAGEYVTRALGMFDLVAQSSFAMILSSPIVL